MPRRHTRTRHNRPRTGVKRELFPSLHAERERALELYDIDIEGSLGDFIEQLGITPRPARSGGDVSRMAVVLELTAREKEVLSLTACGYEKPAIAARLVLSAETVKSHHRHIREKFRVETMTHAVVIGLLLGELDLEILRKELLRSWEGG